MAVTELVGPFSRKSNRIPSFTQVFQAPCRAVLELRLLTGTELRVWCYMLWSLDRENWVMVTQQTLAERLQLTKVTVSRAIQTLMANGLLLREQAIDRRFWCYQVPSDFAHVGRLRDITWRREWEDWQRGMANGERPDQVGR